MDSSTRLLQDSLTVWSDAERGRLREGLSKLRSWEPTDWRPIQPQASALSQRFGEFMHRFMVVESPARTTSFPYALGEKTGDHSECGA